MTRDDPRAEQPFALSFSQATRLGRMCSRAAGTFERLLLLDQVQGIYERASGAADHNDFLRRVLHDMDVSYRLSREDLERIPRAGRLVVVANHPFGAIEGVILAAILAGVRPDARIMANFLLGRIPHLRDLFILVDPFNREVSRRENLRPMREAMRHLDAGGLLGVFPAGEVAHLTLRTRTIADPPWSSTIARIVRKTRSPVLPIFFDGCNSLVFQLLGLLHPRLRTAMLGYELLNKRDSRIDVRIGSVIPYAKLADMDSDEQVTDYLRWRTCMLEYRANLPPRPTRPDVRQAPIIAAQPADALSAEIAGLGSDELMVRNNELEVYCAPAQRIPIALREIGRLRELTFRATGEGTGRAIDLDGFDAHYFHLFVWNAEKREVVGSYRLGPTDRIMQRFGMAGLYTSTLFDYSPELMRRMGPSLELGRSFVRQEYQRSYAPLMLLWKGIGAFLGRNMEYRCLFGPVSISNSYQSVSRQLMVQFLRMHHSPEDLGRLVRARHPVHLPPLPPEDERSARWLLRDSDDVSSLVADIEPDQKGLPILIKQYLKFGAKLLAFNVDPDFSDVIDGLILADLSIADPRTLDRYMGKEVRARYQAHHSVAV